MRWFVIQGNKTSGPFEPDQLGTFRDSGKLRPDHHLRAESGSTTVAALQTSLFTKDGVDIETGDYSPTNIPRVVSGMSSVASRKVMSLVVAGMIAVCLAGSWFFLAGGRQFPEEKDQQTVPYDDGPRVQMEKLHSKINDWKTAKGKLTDLIALLDQDREKLMQQLHNLGVSDPAKSSDDPRVNVLLRELQEVSGQLSLSLKKHENYDLAVFKSESRLRTLERRLSLEDAGLADAELDDLTRTMLALDESLSVESAVEIPVELDETLTKELTEFAGKKQVAEAIEAKNSANANANSPPNDSTPKVTTTDQRPIMPVRPPNEPAVDTASNTLGGSQDTPPPIADEVPKPLLHLSFDDSESKDLHLQNATYAIGKMGRAIQFDGQGFASVNSALPIGNAPRSLSVWLKDTRGPLQNQLIHAVTQGHKPGTAFGIMQANGKWRFFDFNGGLDSGQTVDQQWHHHCVTFDGTTVTYYFDGKPSGEVKRALNTAVAPLMLGTYGDDIEPEKRFIGLIDEVKVFGISLSPEQVEKVMW